MRSFPECEEEASRSKIVLEENKSKMVFLNPDAIAVRKIKVDGYVIKDSKTLRCDYVLIPKDDVEIYIELKGCGVKHAVEQIESTIRALSEDTNKLKKVCFVVATRIYPELSSYRQIQKKRFKENFSATLHIKKTPHEYNLKNLDI
jgi:hypothetical protein